jgi:hypothetical protein
MSIDIKHGLNNVAKAIIYHGEAQVYAAKIAANATARANAQPAPYVPLTPPSRPPYV